MPSLFTIGYDAYKSPGLGRLVQELRRPGVGVNLVIDAGTDAVLTHPGLRRALGRAGAS